MDVDRLIALGQLITPLVLGLVGYAFQQWMHKQLDARLGPIEAQLVERTRPIQPEANGGKSLPDAIRILERLEYRQTDIGDRLARMEGGFQAHIDGHI